MSGPSDETGGVARVSSKPIDAIAFVPINHIQTAGGPEFGSHDFPTGARLRVGMPNVIRRAISELAGGNHFQMANPHEINSLHAAKGFLFIESIIPREECSYPGSVRDMIGKSLVPSLTTLVGCIHICGGGENTHWYWGNFKDRPQIFIYSAEEPVDLPYAMQTFHQFGKHRGANWSAALMDEAGELHQQLWAYRGEENARFSLVYHNYFLMLSLDPESLVRRNMRLQIAVTSLETFYISPKERLYIWSSEVVRRIQYVCSEFADEVDEAIRLIKGARNDIVHRGGLAISGKQSAGIEDALASSEKILRETLSWAIRNRDLMRNIFASGHWPG